MRESATGRVRRYVPAGGPFQIELARMAALVPNGGAAFVFPLRLGSFTRGDSAVIAAHIICRRNSFPQKFRFADFCVFQ